MGLHCVPAPPTPSALPPAPIPLAASPPVAPLVAPPKSCSVASAAHTTRAAPPLPPAGFRVPPRVALVRQPPAPGLVKPGNMLSDAATYAPAACAPPALSANAKRVTIIGDDDMHYPPAEPSSSMGFSISPTHGNADMSTLPLLPVPLLPLADQWADDDFMVQFRSLHLIQLPSENFRENAVLSPMMMCESPLQLHNTHSLLMLPPPLSDSPVTQLPVPLHIQPNMNLSPLHFQIGSVRGVSENRSSPVAIHFSIDAYLLGAPSPAAQRSSLCAHCQNFME
jgi:hypothetical protein